VKTALITGITGQDGYYLTKLLLEKNYTVHGIIRRNSILTTQHLDEFQENKNLILHHGDLSDGTSLTRIIRNTRPDEIYNLAAMSHVGVSFETPELTADVDGLGTLRILEAIRDSNLTETTKFYQASTSELFGKVHAVPQNEETPFHPRSPYGVAKLYAYWITVNYREAYNMFTCNGILFNHESPKRGLDFVTRKISHAVAKVKLGHTDSFKVGNLESKRDWGYAKEYVEGMWRMLQADNPSDYVLATGETHSVREFIENAFKHVDIDIEWNGETGSTSEIGICKNSKRVLVSVDPVFFRPAEVDLLLGEPKKAKDELGWEAQTSFSELVKLMVDEDIRLLKKC
jgi:GDPmannose 4,6-dehydratase